MNASKAVTEHEKKVRLLQNVRRLAMEVGETKLEICQRINVIEDSDLDWLVEDTIAAAATPGGMVFGTDQYTAKRMATIKRLEKKLKIKR